MTPDLLCMILLYDTWYDIVGMIYRSAASFFMAIRSQLRMRRTYRKQKEGEAKREPERECGSLRKRIETRHEQQRKR